MNKKMLETRLASIAHYNKVIKDCEEVITTTISTRKDILKSLIEFFPIIAGQIIYYKGKVMRVSRIEADSISDYGQTFKIKVCVTYSDFRGQWIGDDYHYITHEDALKIKILNLEDAPTE